MDNLVHYVMDRAGEPNDPVHYKMVRNHVLDGFRRAGTLSQDGIYNKVLALDLVVNRQDDHLVRHAHDQVFDQIYDQMVGPRRSRTLSQDGIYNKVLALDLVVNRQDDHLVRHAHDQVFDQIYDQMVGPRRSRTLSQDGIYNKVLAHYQMGDCQDDQMDYRQDDRQNDQVGNRQDDQMGDRPHDRPHDRAYDLAYDLMDHDMVKVRKTMKHVPAMSKLTPTQVRDQGDLPIDGRDTERNVERLTRVLQECLEPDIATYDVDSVQGIDFDEWTYTEGLGCFMVFTQSVEINARLMREVAQESAENQALVTHIADILPDKWHNFQTRGARHSLNLSERSVEVEAEEPLPLEETGKKVFFAPGSNLRWIVSVDNLMREFDADEDWRLKPHPITTDFDMSDMKRSIGLSRLYRRQLSGMQVLRASHTIGYTTASELGLVGMALKKPVVDFTSYRAEAIGRYHSIYKAIRDHEQLYNAPRKVLGRILACPWSGIVPVDTPTDQAAERFRLYKAKTIELRDTFSPMVQRLPQPPRKEERA